MKLLPDNAVKINTDFVDIYALVDPGTNEVKYVGQSDCARQRFKFYLFGKYGHNHKMGKWLQGLKRDNLDPVLYILEIVHHDKASEREIFWINYFGFGELLNGHNRIDKTAKRIRRKTR